MVITLDEQALRRVIDKHIRTSMAEGGDAAGDVRVRFMASQIPGASLRVVCRVEVEFARDGVAVGR